MMSPLTEFITDLFVRRLTEREMRKRWKDGDYSGLNPEHARGYFTMNGIGK